MHKHTSQPEDVGTALLLLLYHIYVLYCNGTGQCVMSVVWRIFVEMRHTLDNVAAIRCRNSTMTPMTMSCTTAQVHSGGAVRSCGFCRSRSPHELDEVRARLCVRLNFTSLNTTVSLPRRFCCGVRLFHWAQ